MNIFETVKCEITMPDVAERYGITVGRNGFVNCIFHNDKHPSMKLYKDHYHCFACGAHGDAVSFTAQLFGLTQYEAAKHLAADFGIEDIKTKRSATTIDWVMLLTKYISVLERNRDKYRPTSPDEDLHPLYVESIQELSLYQYYLDTLRSCTKDEQLQFIKSERRFFYELQRKLRRAGMVV